ncbi:hypothetical protein Q5752_003132 [Cryptotrichosporon argae]
MPAPPNLASLLTSLRAPIFNTLPALTNARTGTKYLRRRLRGPSVLAYLPRAPALTALNASVPWNKYAGWRGDAANSEARGMLPAGQVVEDGFVEVERRARAGPPGTNKKGAERELAGWVDSEAEKVRFDDVARKRRIGKGPPKKGQGRRAQMKKK